MIIFAWKVNNPLSFLISRRASESFKSLFPPPFQFVLEFTKTYTESMLFSYSLNSNHDVSLLGALLLYAVPPRCWPSDGTTQSLGTCLRDFRNKPYPIRAKITYYKKTLTVGENNKWHISPVSDANRRNKSAKVDKSWSYFVLFFFHSRPQVLINNGFTPDKEDYEFCTKVDNMVIPPEGFLGISAATGGLAGIVTHLRSGEFEVRQSNRVAAAALQLLQNQNSFSLIVGIE